MTHLCAAIFVTGIAQAKRDIAAAAEAGADMVELRLDAITDPAMVKELADTSILPAILTCRPTWEGGTSTLSDDARVKLLFAGCTGQTRYIDLELRTFRDTPFDRPENARFILSAHDFAGRPPRLYNILTDMAEAGGEVHKIVWAARTIRDNLEAFDILKSRTKPTIALCMGEAGLISRILAKKFGAFLTFATLSGDSATAPGQITLAEMTKVYRWDAITPATKVYGVVASPVMHSMSPAIHNAGFEATGHDGVYLPLLVNPGYESFKAFMESLLNAEGLDLAGLSITIPHKENSLRYLKEKHAEVEPLADRIGAVNTIVIDPATPAMLRGLNSDYAAILDTITSALAITRQDLATKRIAVIGAGGTGRTAVAALAEYGATVVVYNRTIERAAALAAEFNGRTGQVVAAPLEKLCASCCDIFINTTSVGMHPKVNESPLGDGSALPKLTGETLVFDTIYNPMKTKLLQQAEAAGAKTASGVEMFIRQAARQFEAWTGIGAPTEVFRKVMEKRPR